MTLRADGAEAAAQLLEKVASDRELGDGLARAYDGRHDVLDALWWRAHPGAVTAGGLSDPAAQLPVLAQRAFGRDASPADLTALRDAESTAAADDAALDAAVAAVAFSDRVASASAEGGQESSDGLRLTASVAADEEVVAENPSGRGRSVAAVVAIVAITGLTVACGYLAYRVGESEERFSPGVPVGGLDPFARFTVDQTAADQLDASLPRDYDPSTVRRLVRDEPGLLTDYSLFGARTEDEDICLLMVFPDEEIASSCVSVPEFRRNGIEVSTNVLRPSAVSEGAVVPVAHTVTWQPDDSLLFASSRAEGP